MKLQGRNLTNGTRGDDVRLLHQELRLLGFRSIPDGETSPGIFGPHTLVAVREFQERAKLKVTGIVDEATARVINEWVDRLPGTGGGVVIVDDDAQMYSVLGTVTSPESAAVGGLRVVIVDKNVGPDVDLTQAVTDERGVYSAYFDAAVFHERWKKEHPDLQAKVFAGAELLASSEVRYNATLQETLNVRLPAGAQGLASEYETLLKALARHFNGKLGDLQETEERRDISYLAHKSGWDARAVAMAALADRLGTQTAIPPAFYYALFRAGLPGDTETLYRSEVKAVHDVWMRALEQGVIPRRLEDQVARAEEAFRSLAAAQVLDSRALAGTSTLKEMLRLTFRDDAQNHRRFADLYTSHRGDLPKFWEAAEAAFGPEATKRLRLNGQLAYLTLNNAPLVERLHQTAGGEPLESTLDLVRRGYHRAGKWDEILQDGAIPTEIPGGTPAEKRARYAELLAAQVRVSFPTAVVAEMVRGGEVRLKAEPQVESGVVDFLTRNQGKFEIGAQPIDQFLISNEAGEEITEPVKRQIRRLQRVYQITPSDQAMSALLEDDLDSAFQIVRYDEPEFVALYQEKLGGEQNARLTHAKAQQIHTTVLGIATSYLLARNAPMLGQNPEAPVLASWAGGPEGASDVIAYSPLENLFGSMDFCACDHCRSILSPAAYLVDLLLFIDRPQDGIKNPQTVLLERRPDIKHLPLTCENTNTPLPYIDLVNETLEYFITHNLSLDYYEGHDTGADASPEDLLANPQFVNGMAYDVLKDALFPPPLPFHKSLETLRRTIGKQEIPLYEAMEALRKNDVLDIDRSGPEPPPFTDYGWRDILMERIGLSRAEFRLLTDGTLPMQQIYGFPAAVDPLAELVKAKPFTCRVGITYEELVELLSTRFVRGLGPILLDPMGTTDLCSFDAFEFRRSTSGTATALLEVSHYVGLLRFLRLWKKLGLTIDQTDQLITALSPAGGDALDLERLDNVFLVLLPRIGVVFQVMDRLKLTPAKDLQALLAGWSSPGAPAREWLARKLRLSVQELDLLAGFTGFDPFAPPDPPDPPILHLLRLVEALRAASLKPVQALYLIWNEDVSGKSVPEERLFTDLARRLRAGFTAVESELAVTGAPDAQAARARMAQVYGGEATDFFFGLLENTLRLAVPYDHSREELEDEILEAAGGRLAYDDFRKRLAWSGALGATQRDDIKNVPGVRDAFKAAMDALFAASESATRPFFTRYQDLQPLYDAYVSSTEPPETRRKALLQGLLQNLKPRRKRQQALADVSAALRIDQAFAQAILTDPAVLHAAMDAAQPALDDLTALETPGLAGVTGVWSGYLEAPENGFYRLEIETDSAATVTLTLGERLIDLEQNGAVRSNRDPLDLAAGALVRIALTVGTPVARLEVRWQAEGRGWEPIPDRYLYSVVLIDRLRDIVLRVLKASSLAAALKMTAREMAHFATGQGWLNALPVSGSPDRVTSRSLRDVLITFLDFAHLKARLSPDDERLLTVLRDPAAVLTDGTSLLLSLTGWESASLDALLRRFGLARAALTAVGTFRRAHEAYAVVKKLGVLASALLNAVTNEPSADTVSALQSALRTRYAESDWLAVIRPINDELRGLRRDALVAHVLHKMGERPDSSHIDTPDKLFEYLLMDVQMEPCMQTSRIRHALSSVQLFIERCLMNLENGVASSSINASRWEWMKRYRVWEANRKVFLWPENWLEPELRDDQSPIFKETMSELLQGDITEDRAATALLGYLAKLGEVAKLEPCGIHWDEREVGAANDVVHVVARTPGAHRKYYYRRRAGGAWAPWQPVHLDIEDNPVIPMVWRTRLFLFWLRILQQAPIEPIPAIPETPPGREIAKLSLAELKSEVRSSAVASTSVTIQAVLCWSEFLNGKWQPVRTSDIDRPAELGSFAPAGFNRSSLRLSAREEGEEERKILRISIEGAARRGSFVLYNTHSAPVRQDGSSAARLNRTLGRETKAKTEIDIFTIRYFRTGTLADLYPLTRHVFETTMAGRTVEPRHPLRDPWEAPFFYEDGRHVFYVTTRKGIVELPRYDGSWELPGVNLERYIPLEHDLRFRFVDRDIGIRYVLGTSANFSLNGRLIGPNGFEPQTVLRLE